ncbi:MAG: AraC family transcriptional regulator ligand-binding domain-containing protein, partial [Pseudomonadota bacterium]
MSAISGRNLGPAGDGYAPEPRIWASVIRGLELPLAEHGLDLTDILADCGIEAEELDRAQGSIPLRKYLTFVETAARTANDPLLGLKMSRSTGPEALGAVGFLFLSSRTLLQAISNLCAYANLLQEGTHIQFSTDRNELTFRYQVLRVPDIDCRQDVEFSLGIICRLIRIYAGAS